MQSDREKSRISPMTAKVCVASCIILVRSLSTFEGSGIDGIIPLIQKHYNINDSETAIIRTASSIAHTITLGLVWIFGDSFKRRRLFLSSVAIWIVFAMSSIFLGSESFMVFVIFRSLATAASSIFGVLVPVMLADLFHDRALGVALMCEDLTWMASGLLTGIVSSWIVTSNIPWQSGLLVAQLTTILPLVALLCTKSHIRNVEGSIKERGARRFFTKAFGLFSIKSYLLFTAIHALGNLNLTGYAFWFPSVYLLAWSNVPEIFFGLSYTAVTTINSVVMLTGTFIGLPTMMWFAQSWKHGTGPFSGRRGYERAYPIVVTIGATLNSASFVVSILLMDKSYVASVVVTFFIGLGNAASNSLTQQMLLMVVPASSRAAAVALQRLIAGVVSTPSAQIVGMISDAIRGDSTLPYDRFHAYQLGMLSSSVFLIAAAFCNGLVVVFFPEDCKMAEEKEKEEQESIDEKSFLIGKIRSESILESFVRSRATTVNSFF